MARKTLKARTNEETNTTDLFGKEMKMTRRHLILTVLAAALTLGGVLTSAHADDDKGLWVDDMLGREAPVSRDRTGSRGIWVPGRRPRADNRGIWVPPSRPRPVIDITIMPRHLFPKLHSASKRLPEMQRQFRAWVDYRSARRQELLRIDRSQNRDQYNRALAVYLHADRIVKLWKPILDKVQWYTTLRSTRIVLKGRYANDAVFGRIFGDLQAGRRPTGKLVSLAG